MGALIHAFLLQTSLAVARPTSSYIAIELGAGPVELGWVVAGFSLLPILLAVVIGRALDRGWSNTVLLASVFLILGAGLGLRLATSSIGHLLIWNLAMGLGLLGCLLSVQRLVSRAAGEHQDRFFGLYTTAAAAGHVCGPLIVGWLGGEAVAPDTDAILMGFLLSALLLMGATVPLLAAPRNQSRGPARTPSFSRAFAIGKCVARGLMASITLSMLVLVAIDLLQVYLPALAAERGISARDVSLLLAMRAAGTALSRLGLGVLVRRLGRTRTLVSSSCMAGLLLFVAVLPLQFAAAVITLLVLGIALGISQPISMAAIGTHAPCAHHGTWFAIRLSGSRLGQVVLPIALSSSTAAVGAAGVLMGSGVLLLLASLITIPPLRQLEERSHFDRNAISAQLKGHSQGSATRAAPRSRLVPPPHHEGGGPGDAKPEERRPR